MPRLGYELRVEGLAQFRRELRSVNPAFARELAKLHRTAAKEVSEAARGAAKRSRSKTAIRPRGRATGAFIDLVPGPRGDALIEFLGAKRRTGWYAAPWFSAGSRQHPKWVGNQWAPGQTGGIPYNIGPAVNASLDPVEKIILDGYERISRRAFPH